MNSIFRIYAVFIKQVKDSINNRLIIMLFFMFPILAIIFKGLVKAEELDMLLPSFITMNTVMVPIIFMSSVVSEEKEKHSLQMLIMSNVKAWEYLIGIGTCVFIQAFISSCLFLVVYDVPLEKLAVFFINLAIGIACSLLVGAILAILAKNQMSVGPITAPVSMVIGLLPMFAEINDKLKSVATVFYSYYIRKAFVTLEISADTISITTIIINFFSLLLIFVLLYKFRKFNDD